MDTNKHEIDNNDNNNSNNEQIIMIMIMIKMKALIQIINNDTNSNDY